mgnify:CR=1 FL=1
MFTNEIFIQIPKDVKKVISKYKKIAKPPLKWGVKT